MSHSNTTTTRPNRLVTLNMLMEAGLIAAGDEIHFKSEISTLDSRGNLIYWPDLCNTVSAFQTAVLARIEPENLARYSWSKCTHYPSGKNLADLKYEYLTMARKTRTATPTLAIIPSKQLLPENTPDLPPPNRVKRITPTNDTSCTSPPKATTPETTTPAAKRRPPRPTNASTTTTSPTIAMTTTTTTTTTSESQTHKFSFGTQREQLDEREKSLEEQDARDYAAKLTEDDKYLYSYTDAQKVATIKYQRTLIAGNALQSTRHFGDICRLEMNEQAYLERIRSLEREMSTQADADENTIYRLNVDLNAAREKIRTLEQTVSSQSSELQRQSAQISTLLSQFESLRRASSNIQQPPLQRLVPIAFIHPQSNQVKGVHADPNSTPHQATFQCPKFSASALRHSQPVQHTPSPPPLPLNASNVTV